MTASMRQQLAGLLELAGQMQACAVAADWDGVAVRRDTLQQQVETLFAEGASPEEAPELGEVIRQIIDMNGTVITHCRAARDAHAAILEDLRAGRRAVSSYAANAG